MKRLFVALAFPLLLGACATQRLQTHALPPETPAAENAAAAARASELAEIEAAAKSQPKSDDGDGPVPTVTPADAPPMRTYDPWERLNRFTYRFNARFDDAVFLPVANGYRRLPSPVRTGVHNFFGNLAEVDSMINFALQGRLGFGARSLGRFVINTTIGIGGLFDVASNLHLAPAATGFGTTLAKWGVHPGPYLVLPFLGPSTLRDGFGLLGDFGTEYAVDLGGLYQSDNAWMLGVANAIDQRAHVSFRYYQTGSPFEYENVRFLYVRKRLLEDEGLHRHELPEKPAPGEPAGK
ncbi:MAG TPA: VacJ family lipoprotein [Dokdonella sp.]